MWKNAHLCDPVRFKPEGHEWKLDVFHLYGMKDHRYLHLSQDMSSTCQHPEMSAETLCVFLPS